MRRFARRLLLTLAIGVACLLGFAPFDQHWLGVLGVLALLVLLRDLRHTSVTRVLGWSLGVAFAIAVLAFAWVYTGLRNMGGLGAGAALAAFGLYVLVCYTKVPLLFLGARLLAARTRLRMVWLAAVLVLAGDLFSYQLFPWYFGNLSGGNVFLRQAAALVGTPALGFLIVLEAALVGRLLAVLRNVLVRRRPARWRSYLARPTVLVWAGVLALVYAFGVWRVVTADFAREPQVTVAYFQPNLGPGYERLRQDDEFAGRALNLVFNFAVGTLLDGRGQVDLLIFPESAVPFFGTADGPGNQGIYSTTFHAIVAFLARYGEVDVLYNELIGVPPTGSESAGASGSYRNAATIFGREGTRRASYAKRRLVAFGEYIPGEDRWPHLRTFFPEASRYVGAPPDAPRVLEYRRVPYRAARVLARLTQDDLDVLLDARRVLADWPTSGAAAEGAYLVPLLCYEGLFPDLVRDAVRAGTAAGTPPDFLVNMSNDSWFGDVLENGQHAGAARMRAVETGRALVRPTLTGVSQSYDPLGNPLSVAIGVGQAGGRVVRVPRRPQAMTPYLFWGDWPAIGIVGAFVIGGFISRRR